MELVALDPRCCSACGALVEPVTVDQPALLRHGGFGATRRRRLRVCSACSTVFEHETGEIAP